MPLPGFIHKYFWDIDTKSAHPRSYPEYYITRILEFGDKKAFAWLQRIFGNRKILTVAKKAHLSPKSKNFWRLVFK